MKTYQHRIFKAILILDKNTSILSVVGEQQKDWNLIP